MDEQYFTVKEIAERLRYRDYTIRQEIRAGRLRAIKIGDEYRISAKDLAAYLRKMATAPEEDEGVGDKVAC